MDSKSNSVTYITCDFWIPEVNVRFVFEDLLRNLEVLKGVDYTLTLQGMVESLGWVFVYNRGGDVIGMEIRDNASVTGVEMERVFNIICPHFEGVGFLQILTNTDYIELKSKSHKITKDRIDV